MPIRWRSPGRLLRVDPAGGLVPLMLALRARGLGSTWTSLHLLHEAEAAATLGIPDGVTQTVLLPVGYTKDAVLRPANRKPPREVMRREGSRQAFPGGRQRSFATEIE
ncbi:MAG: hypothetical protein IH884_11170 [Myxococcales bacterium]|nr:hypothetical protein [Myxococcales bacterium]